jgi:hypothetical protein
MTRLIVQVGDTIRSKPMQTSTPSVPAGSRLLAHVTNYFVQLEAQRLVNSGRWEIVPDGERKT